MKNSNSDFASGVHSHITLHCLSILQTGQVLLGSITAAGSDSVTLTENRPCKNGKHNKQWLLPQLWTLNKHKQCSQLFATLVSSSASQSHEDRRILCKNSSTLYKKTRNSFQFSQDFLKAHYFLNNILLISSNTKYVRNLRLYVFIWFKDTMLANYFLKS